MVAPEVKRKAEAEYKATQVAKSGYVAPPTLNAGQQGALSDRDIAANMLAQAKAMEINARSMVAEAARMKKDAERMDPTVTARAVAPNVASESSVAEAPKRRTRGPNKPKTAVADATHG
jgi:hypothetical protein